MPQDSSEADPFGTAPPRDPAAAEAHLRAAAAGAVVPRDLAALAPAPPEAVGVAGGGPGGVSTAVALAAAGLRVVLVEPDPHDRQRAADMLTRLGAGAGVAPGTWRVTDDADVLRGLALVIETGETERRADLLSALPGDAVIAAATLGAPLAALARSVPAPDRLIGLVLEPPAHATRLAEIGGHPGSAPAALALGFALAARLGRIAVRSDGIGARLNLRALDEADALMLDGAAPWEIDEAMTGFGYAPGPLEAQDLAGLPLAQIARRARPPRPADVIQARMVAEGRLGKAAGVGWYRYPGGGGAVIDPLIEDLVREEAHFARHPERAVRAPEIRRRLLLAQLDEAARLLDAGAARCAGDVDLVSVHGAGFPAARGGLLHWADRAGAGRLMAAWREDELGAPAPRLVRLAREGGRFADLPAGGPG